LDSIKRAKGTRAKIRSLMSALFTHAMRMGGSKPDQARSSEREAGAHS
jgi:hypothetical protein